jgi:hypothetical protein
VSVIALDAVKAIREHLTEVIADLDRMADALQHAPPGAIEDVELPVDALDGLPWKAYTSGNGAWIFADHKDATAAKLRETLTSHRGTLELHGFRYRFSGQQNRFISRYPTR